MNAPSRLDTTPRLEDYPFRLSDNVRFGDLDPNQHVNNAVYATYFETGRVTLMKLPEYGLTPPGLAWIMVRLDMHFRAELHWPNTIELGLGVVKLGTDVGDVRAGRVFEREVHRVCDVSRRHARRGDATAGTADLRMLEKLRPWHKRGIVVAPPSTE